EHGTAGVQLPNYQMTHLPNSSYWSLANARDFGPLPLRGQNPAHGLDEPLPPRGGRHQLLTAQRRKPVILRATGIRRGLPLAGNPSSLEQALQRGIERTVVDQKLIVRLLLQKLADAVGVIRPQLQAAQDQDLERALQEFQALPWIVYGRHSIYI